MKNLILRGTRTNQNFLCEDLSQAKFVAKCINCTRNFFKIWLLRSISYSRKGGRGNLRRHLLWVCLFTSDCDRLMAGGGRDRGLPLLGLRCSFFFLSTFATCAVSTIVHSIFVMLYRENSGTMERKAISHVDSWRSSVPILRKQVL
jgi:hypothetical protein